jgi:hypothetical protein
MLGTAILKNSSVLLNTKAFNDFLTISATFVLDLFLGKFFWLCF